MELVKKQTELDLIVKSNSKIVDYTRKGIVITNTCITHNTTQNKQMSKTQTCFKLKVVNSPEVAKMFI